MPRYIDAVELVQVLDEHMTMVADKSGSRDNDVIIAYLMAKDHAIDYVNISPTADVIPKAEVEALKNLNERLMSELSKAREQIAFMKRAEELDKIPKW